jgi:YgiT-type zinc finger domain-containing protein
MGRRKAMMRCDLCGVTSAQVRHVTRSFGRGDRLLVIENIPSVSCRQCGQRHFTAATMRGLERLKRSSVDRMRRKAVPVVSFSAA